MACKIAERYAHHLHNIHTSQVKPKNKNKNKMRFTGQR